MRETSSSYNQSVAVPLPPNGDIGARIGEDCGARLNAINMFAGSGGSTPCQ